MTRAALMITVAASLSACAGGVDAPATVPVASRSAPAFTAVQPALFAVPGSLSNAWADYDNDGDPDLAVSIKTGDVRLYRNDRGTFVSVGGALGLPTAGHEFRGLSWADYDADGFVDLFAGPTAADKPSALFRNEGARRFVDVAAAVGLTIPGRSARATNFVDYDNDGDLDVYATDRAGPNRLYRNDPNSSGEARFARVLAGDGVSDPRPTVGACWFDYDRDGDLDLFLANQAGATDALWRNDGTGFVDVARAAGVDNPGRTREEGGVGCAVGDYDNDGDFDLFVPNYGRNALYRNDGNGTFADVARAFGMDADNHAVGAAWGDYDADGFLDLFVTAYQGPSGGGQVPRNVLFHNDRGAGFTNVLAPESPVDAGDHGVEWIDYDRDGALDLSLTDGYGPVGGHPVFRNVLPPPPGRVALRVSVTDASGRSNRPGSEVRVLDRAGGILGSRLVSTGGGYGAQSSVPVQFSLAAGSPVDVEVTFMGRAGRRTTRKRISPNAYRSKVLVIRETP